jgi:hypothetical protein
VRQDGLLRKNCLQDSGQTKISRQTLQETRCLLASRQQQLLANVNGQPAPCAYRFVMYYRAGSNSV